MDMYIGYVNTIIEASTDLEPSINQGFDQLRVVIWQKCSHENSTPFNV